MLSPTSCHDHRQQNAAHYNSSTLPLSRIYQLPSFPDGPAESVSGQVSKTAEVVENIGRERNLFILKLIFESCV